MQRFMPENLNHPLMFQLYFSTYILSPLNLVFGFSVWKATSELLFTASDAKLSTWCFVKESVIDSISL